MTETEFHAERQSIGSLSSGAFGPPERTTCQNGGHTHTQLLGLWKTVWVRDQDDHAQNAFRERLGKSLLPVLHAILIQQEKRYFWCHIQENIVKTNVKKFASYTPF
ncbi:uncharacterized protein LOC144581571 [Callithrix jacchus]